MRIFFLIFVLGVISFSSLSQSPLKKRDTTIKGPQTFGMIVGISKYKYIRPLAFADKDAELFRDYLRSPAGGNVSSDNIFVLLNDEADNANFWTKGFQWLRAKHLQRGDKLFIYLAGHGDAIDEDQFFFLSVDCNPGGDKNNYLVGGAIQLFNLKKKIAAETAKGVEVFFIMDACRSNELPGGIAGLNFLNSAITEKKAGEVIMLATGAGQESLEDASIGSGQGLFTYYLVDGLIGAADTAEKDNRITLHEIQSYVNANVLQVAQNRFNRIQSPFFCCDDKSENVISRVDTSYFKNWLQSKKQVNRTGNSFLGNIASGHVGKAVKQKAFPDTSLIETYGLFYKAIKEKSYSGRTTALSYYEILEKKFPDNPYTLDAKSTLASSFIRFAQSKVLQHISCGEFPGKNKSEIREAADRLEKAIHLLKDEDPEFAQTLLSRMYFLKACGEENNHAFAFRNAYACLSLDPDAAFINNRLAILHLENKQTDSAVYYAKKAIRLAPQWPCSYTTLSLTYNILQMPDSVLKYNQSLNPDGLPTLPVHQKHVAGKPRKTQFGFYTGAGINNIKISLSNWDQRNINYADSLNSIQTKNGSSTVIASFCQINFNEAFAWRPAVSLFSNSNKIIYDRKPSSGLPDRMETLVIKSASAIVESPFIFNFKSGKITPYLSFGPSFAFLIYQPVDISEKFPLKSFELLGNAGAGLDIGFKQSNIILSPEFRFSAAFNSIKGDANNIYTNTLSSFRRQSFMFNLYLRKK
ncbi:MAG TPA: caspase family protein [Chitinophagaceae bacterium]|nr:caspase family protein [Chitinophagaceae bacterium]